MKRVLKNLLVAILVVSIAVLALSPSHLSAAEKVNIFSPVINPHSRVRSWTDKHSAIDFKVASGTNLYAVANGTVIAKSVCSQNHMKDYKDLVALVGEDNAKYNDVCPVNCFGAGTSVTLQFTKNGSTYKVKYSHCSQILVNVGDTVSEGQIIAKSGNTGISEAAHLDFSVIMDGKTVNPDQVFEFRNSGDEIKTFNTNRCSYGKYVITSKNTYLHSGPIDLKGENSTTSVGSGKCLWASYKGTNCYNNTWLEISNNYIYAGDVKEVVLPSITINKTSTKSSGYGKLTVSFTKSGGNYSNVQYEIHLTNSTTGKVSSYITSSLTTSLTGLAKGSYTVKVRAVLCLDGVHKQYGSYSTAYGKITVK